jgi:phosphate-selective porin OprO/OprP
LTIHAFVAVAQALALAAVRAEDDSLPFPPPPPLGSQANDVKEGDTKAKDSSATNKQSDQEKKDDKEKSSSEDKESTQVKFNLEDGLTARSRDEHFRFHVGGRFDWDSGWYRVPQNIQQSLGSTPLLDGTDLRRFRLGADGTVWEQVDFKVEADFSRAADFKSFQSTPQTNIFITDAWLAVRDLPIVDTVRAGHQKEYLTFDNATSAKFQPFMERSYIFDAFEDNFSWDNGLATYRTYCDQRLTSWLGVFWNGTRSQAFNVGGHYAVSGRLTWLPVYSEDEQRWLNVGVSGSVRAIQTNDPNSVTVRPLVRTGESFQVPNLIDSGALLSRDGLQILGAGVHSAWGPLTVGGEFLCWSIANAYTGSLPNPNGTLPPGAQAVGDLFFSGFYVEALYFLTPGDHRPLNREIPGFDRVRPVRNFLCMRDGSGCGRGPGAWEIGIRYDHVDVNSGLIQAGTLDSVTFGVNWFLNPNARVTVNYVWTDRDTGSPASSGHFDAFGVRVHFDF